MLKFDLNPTSASQTTHDNSTSTTTSTTSSAVTWMGERELGIAEMLKLLESIDRIGRAGIDGSGLQSIKTHILSASDAQRAEIIQYITRNNFLAEHTIGIMPDCRGAAQKRDIINFCRPCAPLTINAVNTVTLAQSSAVSSLTNLPRHLQDGNLYKRMSIYTDEAEAEPVAQALKIIAQAWGEIGKLDRATDRRQLREAFCDSFAFGDIGKLFPVLAQPIQRELLEMAGLEPLVAPFCSFLGSTTATSGEVKAYLAGKEDFNGYFAKQPRWIELSKVYTNAQNENTTRTTSIKEIDRQLALLEYGRTAVRFGGRTNAMYIFHRANEFCQAYERAVMRDHGDSIDNGPGNEDYDEKREAEKAIGAEKETGRIIRRLSLHIKNNFDEIQKEAYGYPKICATLFDGQLEDIASDYDSIAENRISLRDVISVVESAFRADPAPIDPHEDQEGQDRTDQSGPGKAV